MYQEKIVLPKQMKQIALMYKLKETRKKSLYFLFCFTMVVCPDIRFYVTAGKQNQFYDEAVHCACTEAQKCHSKVVAGTLV